MSFLRLTIFLLSAAIVTLLIGFFAAEYSPFFLIGAVIALSIFLLTFLNTEIGLYILIFSMLLSPEIGVGGLEGKAALGRGVTLRFDDFLLVVIGFSWLAKNAVYKELGLFLKTSLNRPIFYYMVVCLLATSLGTLGGRVDAKTGFFYVLKYFEYFIVFFMVANHVETEAQLKRFLVCLFLTCLITAVIGIGQIPGGERISAPFEGERGEPNTFGGYLVFMGAVAAGIIPAIRNKQLRWAMILGIFIIVIPLFYTQSRSSYLSAVPAIIALGFMSRKRTIIFGVLLMGLIASPLLLPSTVKERIAFTFQQVEQQGQIRVGDVRLDTSLSARLLSWRDGLKGWARNPVIGYGVTGYSFMDAQYVRVLVETGIIGLFAFLYLLYSISKMIRAVSTQVADPLYRGLIRGATAGYVSLLFHALGANTFIIVRIMEPFWFVIGLVAVLPALEAIRVREEEYGTFGMKEIKERTLA